MDQLLDRLLEPRVPPQVETLDDWWRQTAAARDAFGETIDRALVAGTCADRMGFAFAAGYEEALRRLVPGSTGIAALCATEAGGNHPRAIQTTLANGELTGKKTWVTAGSIARTLLVVASVGADPDGKNRLRVVRVAADAPGVAMRATSAPFVPEIPHAELTLDHVRVAEADVLPGDGYDDYLKPFRTVEDAHVQAALVGYLIGVSLRREWRPQVERLLACALAIRGIGLADRKARATHLALAGGFALIAVEVAAVEERWAAAGDAEYERWRRDRPLLEVAGKARAARRERAWTTP